MMKWLRAHTKQIMVVVVLLAMLSFVGGSALYSFFATDPADEVVMEAFGRKVTQGELNAAVNETRTLERLLLSWKYHGEMNLRHWFLLAEEAERAGVVVPDSEVDSLVEQVDQFRQQRNLGSLDQLRVRGKIPLSMIRRAVKHHLAIRKNAYPVMQTAAPSEPQVRHYVHDTQDKVKVEFVALDAKDFVLASEVIPEEELQAYFDKYKDVDPAEDDLGRGYRFPRRVKVQYVVASAVKIQPEVKVSLDEIKTYWKVNKSRYNKTVYVDPPPPASAPATILPAEKPKPIPQQQVKAFSEARPDVERELRKRKALKVARQAIIKLADELIRPWIDAPPSDQQGYKTIPPGVAEPVFMNDAGDQIAQRFGITLDRGMTGLLSKEQLGEHYRLKGATTPGEGDEPLGLAEYAFRLPLFYEVDQSQETSLRLQLFQPPTLPLTVAGQSSGYTIVGGRLVQKPGEPENFVLFRVIEAVEAQAPTSLAEVRSQVEQDIRLNRAFDRLATLAGEYFAVAQRLGVDAAMDRFDDLRKASRVLKASKPAPFARSVRLSDPALRDALLAGKPVLVTTTVPGVGESDEFVDACFSMSEENWVAASDDIPDTERTRTVTTQPAIDPAPKIQLLPIRRLQKWFVIQLGESQPANSDQYETQFRRSAYAALSQDRAAVVASRWYAPNMVEQRCGYVDVRALNAQDSGDPGEAPKAPQSVRF